jgi:uncharacterized protein with PIN domain
MILDTSAVIAIIQREPGWQQLRSQLEQAPLPVVLWRFGLISLEQFDALLTWQAQE